MKRVSLSVLMAIALSICGLSNAFANQELATAKNCMACHAIDHKVVGPGYQDVAKNM